jgi:hypothetical protein
MPFEDKKLPKYLLTYSVPLSERNIFTFALYWLRTKAKKSLNADKTSHFCLSK